MSLIDRAKNSKPPTKIESSPVPKIEPKNDQKTDQKAESPKLEEDDALPADTDEVLGTKGAIEKAAAGKDAAEKDDVEENPSVLVAQAEPRAPFVEVLVTYEDGYAIDDIGITLDTANMLEAPPCWLIYGVSGLGKTTQAAIAFHDALWLVTNRQVLRPYASWVRANWALTVKQNMRTPVKPNDKFDPKRPDGPTNRRWVARLPHEGGMFLKVLPSEFRDDGKTRQDPRPFVDLFLEKWRTVSKANINPYKGVIFDEASEFLWRIGMAEERDPENAKNKFAKVVKTKEWCYRIMGNLRDSERMGGFLCHELQPRYNESGQDDSPTKNQLIQYGGPDVPISTLIHDVVALWDIILRVKLTSTGKRVFQCHPDGKYLTKFRDFSVQKEEPLDFLKVMRTAQYNI